VWDGHQWQPVPVVVGDVAGVAPVLPAAAVPAPAPVRVAYTPPQAATPAIPYAAPAAEESAVPLWQEAPREGIQGTRLYLFGAAAVVVLIMAMMALNSLNLVRMPWQSDGYNPPKPAVTPTPQLATRSDYARADRFLNFNLSPAIAAYNQTLPELGRTCNGTLSNSCLSAITATDVQLKNVLVVIDKADIPPCIAPGMTKIRADFNTMETGMQIVLKGFKDDSKPEANQGYQQFLGAGAALQADAKAVDLALKTQCSTDQTGP
jgi:hypothetical protein